MGFSLKVTNTQSLTKIVGQFWDLRVPRSSRHTNDQWQWMIKNDHEFDPREWPTKPTWPTQSSTFSLTKKMSKWFLIRGSGDSLLFLNELILRWSKNKFFRCFLRKSLTLVKKSVSLSVFTESWDTSVFTVLLPSLFCSSCQFSESAVFKRLTTFSLNRLCLCVEQTCQSFSEFWRLYCHAWGKLACNFRNNSRSILFIFLTFALRYPLCGTRPDIITLLPLSSLTDYDRFIISAAIFPGSLSLLISLVPQLMIIFSGFFFNGWFSMPKHVTRFGSSERFHYNFLFIIWEFPSL